MPRLVVKQCVQSTSVWCSLLWGSLVASLGALACGARVPVDENGSGGGSSPECAAEEQRLADDGCGICTCRDGLWDCPTTTGPCEVSCVDGVVVPSAGACGLCTCIDDVWVCDREADCECDYEPANFDPYSCSRDDCTPYGRFDGCGSGGEVLDDDLPGLDPFAVDEVVPCEDLVPRLGDRGAFGLSNPEVDGTRLSLTIQYEGGCGPHRFGLCLFLRSDARPLENNVRIVEVEVAHDRGDDLCGQPESVTKSFDLARAIELYEDRMERFGLERSDRMLLRVRDYGDRRTTIPVLFDE